MGLISESLSTPTPCGYIADDRLAAGFHRYMLNPHRLLTLAAVLVQRVHKHCVRSQEFVREVQHALPGFLVLAWVGEPTITVHDRFMGDYHLCDQMPFNGILGLHRNNSLNCGQMNMFSFFD